MGKPNTNKEKLIRRTKQYFKLRATKHLTSISNHSTCQDIRVSIACMMGEPPLVDNGSGRILSNTHISSNFGTKKVTTYFFYVGFHIITSSERLLIFYRCESPVVLVLLMVIT